MTTFDGTAARRGIPKLQFLEFAQEMFALPSEPQNLRTLSCASRIVTGRHKTCDDVMLF